MRHEIHIRGLDLVEKPHDEKLELVERKASILEKFEMAVVVSRTYPQAKMKCQPSLNYMLWGELRF